NRGHARQKLLRSLLCRLKRLFRPSLAQAKPYRISLFRHLLRRRYRQREAALRLHRYGTAPHEILQLQTLVLFLKLAECKCFYNRKSSMEVCHWQGLSSDCHSLGKCDPTRKIFISVRRGGPFSQE